jgi:capsular exopolysaccharide synthesis family protein
VPRNPAELLASKEMQSLIALLKNRFDYILIDTPPVMPLTDACILGKISDGVILVVQAGRTQRGIIKHALERLQQAGPKVLGYIMTNVEYHLPQYLYRYIQEYSHYKYEDANKNKEKEEILVDSLVP